MKKTCYGMSVDAGLLCIADLGYLVDEGAELDKYEEGRHDIRQIIELSPGLYNIDYEVPDSYNGRIDGSCIINCKSGKLLVGDPCYNFDKKWGDFLQKTDYCRISNEFFQEIATGGDGSFDIKLNITKK